MVHWPVCVFVDGIHDDSVDFGVLSSPAAAEANQ